MNDDVVCNHFARNLRRLTNGQQVRADIAFDLTFDLNIA